MEHYKKAADLIQHGELVAFPTETVYGLGARADLDTAVAKIYATKKRPTDQPLLIHVKDFSSAEALFFKKRTLRKQLMEHFWPGPLAIIDDVRPDMISPWALAGLSTIGVRIPSHPDALTFLRETNLPIAAPSVNLFTKTSATHYEHVVSDFPNIFAIPTTVPCGGIESTVVRVSSDQIELLRPGLVSKEQLETIGPVIMNLGDKASPGSHHLHYAPEAPLFLIDPEQDPPLKHREEIQPRQILDEYFFKDLSQATRELYPTLRSHHVGTLIAKLPPSKGLGLAIRDRLIRASSGFCIAKDGKFFRT